MQSPYVDTQSLITDNFGFDFVDNHFVNVHSVTSAGCRQIICTAV